jgi:transposase-like protein
MDARETELDVLLQKRRNKAAAARFFRKNTPAIAQSFSLKIQTARAVRIEATPRCGATKCNS